ncbi:hypothetical protein [Amnibacterium sp.]|uniref:hypothetical protein n=1 Tax=Amnibacterium sp. TaxID=1872496 RepID=UPI003F7CB886
MSATADPATGRAAVREQADAQVAAAPAPGSSRPVPQWLRRGLTFLAALALIPEAQRLWKVSVSRAPTLNLHSSTTAHVQALLLLVALAAFGVLLTTAVLAVGSTSDRGIRRLDAAVLAVGVVLLLGEFVLSHAVNDEGALTAKAADALLHGTPVYGVDWPGLVTKVPLTKTMGGGADYQYGYPPLAVLLTAAVTLLHHSAAAAAVVTTAALLAATIVLWWRVAPVWRPIVVIALLALEPIAGSAAGGSPILVAIALLVPVLLRFDRTGADGRLGATGVLKGAALGAACASQQLAWFLLPFLVVALYALRVREVGHRGAALVVGRFLGTAAAVWLLIDLPFIVTQPAAWAQGILIPLAQHGIIHGQSLVDIPYLLTRGSGALDLFSTATILLFAGLLVAVLLFPARLGPALTILPVAVFFVATRSDYAYWLQFSPIWLATVATVPVASFGLAWRPRVVGRLLSAARAGIVALLTVPPLLIALVGAFTPPPLQLHLDVAASVPGKRSAIGEVTVTAVNVSDHVVAPHFCYLEQGGASNWWEILHGPTTLHPGQRAVYVIEPTGEQQPLVRGSAILAVSDQPMTASSVPLPASLRRR